MSEKKLTPKQDRFCREYVIDLNGTQAAIRAGYSAKTANRIASENLSKPDIQSQIGKLAKTVQDKAEVSAERILEELKLIGHFDPAEIVGKVSKVEDIALLPPHVRRAIAGWSWDKFGCLVLKFHDKQRALELLGRHKTLFTDRIETEHSGDVTFNMVVQAEKKPTKGKK